VVGKKADSTVSKKIAVQRNESFKSSLKKGTVKARGTKCPERSFI
jgi:hypothetical protein